MIERPEIGKLLVSLGQRHRRGPSFLGSVGRVEFGRTSFARVEVLQKGEAISDIDDFFGNDSSSRVAL
jgi:hypothetical protein